MTYRAPQTPEHPPQKQQIEEIYGEGAQWRLERYFTAAGQFTCVVPRRQLQSKECSFQSFDDATQGILVNDSGCRDEKARMSDVSAGARGIEWGLFRTVPRPLNNFLLVWRAPVSFHIDEDSEMKVD
ncbi:hypothetical protein ACEPPN_004250 [Leptodophora sp. 'Broadleaf-Isolate-01']